jgi:phenylacetate-CoA ligase
MSARAGAGAPMYEPEIETRPWSEQRRLDDAFYRRQVAYLLARSRFYQVKLKAAGFASPEQVGRLDDIAALPLTEKDELRAGRSAADPLGSHLAAPMEEVARIYATSGTTGAPSYIPLTASDVQNWVRTSARSYAASGVRAGQRIVSTYNAGPFVAGAALDAFNRLGLCHIPIGTGNTERLMAAVQQLRPQALVLTPSYALHLAEWARQRGLDPAASSVERVLVAGEPGGGEPALRARLEAAWGARVTEAMGIGDIAVSLWGECEEQAGMHLGGRGFVHVELIEPESGVPVPLADGARGELVLTHLCHRAAPLLRFRTRDHVELWTGPCRCGRTAPRVRCIGRTDDLLIVRGINVFPSAVRDVVDRFRPAVSGVISIRPRAQGPRQEPPLPVVVELAEGQDGGPALAERIERHIRETLIVTTAVSLVPRGTLSRSEYKSKLVDRPGADA